MAKVGDFERCLDCSVWGLGRKAPVVVASAASAHLRCPAPLHASHPTAGVDFLIGIVGLANLKERISDQSRNTNLGVTQCPMLIELCLESHHAN